MVINVRVFKTFRKEIMVLAKQFDLKSFVLRFPLGLLSGVRAIQKKTLACHFIYQIKLGSLRRVALAAPQKSHGSARAE
jgi:hypothetical protein